MKKSILMLALLFLAALQQVVAATGDTVSSLKTLTSQVKNAQNARTYSVPLKIKLAPSLTKDTAQKLKFRVIDKIQAPEDGGVVIQFKDGGKRYIPEDHPVSKIEPNQLETVLNAFIDEFKHYQDQGIASEIIESKDKLTDSFKLGAGNSAEKVDPDIFDTLDEDSLIDVSDYLVELMVEPMVILDADLLVSQVSDFMAEIFTMAANSYDEVYTEYSEGLDWTSSTTTVYHDNGTETTITSTTSHSPSTGETTHTTTTKTYNENGDETSSSTTSSEDKDNNGYPDDNNDGGFDWPFSNNITAESEAGRTRITTAYLTHLFLSSDELVTLQDNVTSLHTGKMKSAVFVTTVKKLFSASAAELKPVLVNELNPSLVVKKVKVN